MLDSAKKMIFLIAVVLSIRHPIGETQISSDVVEIDDRISAEYPPQNPKLEYDYYRQTCPQAEDIVRSTMAKIFDQYKDTPPALLRLLFHDCFIRGCDASILLADSDNSKNYTVERDAIPNQTLRGFDKINTIKEEVEKACPRVVSCADILALATRDGILLAGGPFYPVCTGRKDSVWSFYSEAMEQIPNPDDNITRILGLFSQRGFNDRETVALLGSHNIGKISCKFIRNRLENFMATGMPDPTMDPDFLNAMRSNCRDDGNTSDTTTTGNDYDDDAEFPSSLKSRALDESASVFGTSHDQEVSISIPSGVGFDSHYYERLVRKRGLLHSDQQLMTSPNTAQLVNSYASDGGSASFRRDFARAMIKMSSLGVLTASQGQVRINCSMPFLPG